MSVLILSCSVMIVLFSHLYGVEEAMCCCLL